MSIGTEGIDQFVAMFAAHGGTEESYLRDHFPRFVATRQLLLAHCDPVRNRSVLDVGAHWLHQALLYALDGFEVMALDLPLTLGLPPKQFAYPKDKMRFHQSSLLSRSRFNPRRLQQTAFSLHPSFVNWKRERVVGQFEIHMWLLLFWPLVTMPDRIPR